MRGFVKPSHISTWVAVTVAIAAIWIAVCNVEITLEVFIKSEISEFGKRMIL